MIRQASFALGQVTLNTATCIKTIDSSNDPFLTVLQRVLFFLLSLGYCLVPETPDAWVSEAFEEAHCPILAALRPGLYSHQCTSQVPLELPLRAPSLTGRLMAYPHPRLCPRSALTVLPIDSYFRPAVAGAEQWENPLEVRDVREISW